METNEAYLKAKELIESKSFELLAEKLEFLKKADPNDSDGYMNVLKKIINAKFSGTCDSVVTKASSIMSITDVAQLETISEQVKSLKEARTLLSEFIDVESTKHLEGIISKQLEIHLKKYLESDRELNIFSDSKLRELLCYLIGPNVFDLINPKVDCPEISVSSSENLTDATYVSLQFSRILTDLGIHDKGNLHENMYKSFVSQGKAFSLQEFEKKIAKNKLDRLEEKLTELRNSLASPDLRSFVLNALKEHNIDDDIIEEMTEAILSQGVNAIEKYRDDIIPDDFSSLQNKLQEIPSLKENSIMESVGEDEEFVLNLLKELNVDNKEDKHKMFARMFFESGIANCMLHFEKKIAKNKLTQLEKKLNERFPAVFSRKSYEEELQNSTKKYRLTQTIDFSKFNSLEGFSTPLDDIIRKLCDDYESKEFAESAFSIMIYLIKRQQNLTDFIEKFNFRVNEKWQTSLKELVYQLLANSQHEVKIKIFQLLHSTNPVPFLSYFSQQSEYGLELEFHSESYWVTAENTIAHKILSISFDAACKGKTRLINSIFSTNFEETLKASLFFMGTMDMQVTILYVLCILQLNYFLILKPFFNKSDILKRTFLFRFILIEFYSYYLKNYLKILIINDL